MPNHVTSVITLSGDENRIKTMLEQIKKDEVGVGKVDFNKILTMQESLNMKNGYFRVKESVYETNGQTRTYQQTFVTGKGQQYILSRLMREYGGVINA